MEAEHQYILECLKNGLTLVNLRDGKLIMNLSLGFFSTETDSLTDEQEVKKYQPKLLGTKPEVMKLLGEEDRQTVQGFAPTKNIHQEFMQRMAEKFGGKWNTAWDESIWNPKNRTAKV